MIKPYFTNDNVTIYNGNSEEVLKNLPAESVNCCVTSPPYFALRDYFTGKWVGGNDKCEHKMTAEFICEKCGAKYEDDQVGQERSPEKYVDRLVKIFAEVKRILKPDGTFWLNLGDSYWSGHGITEGSTPEYNQGRVDRGETLNQPYQELKFKATGGKHEFLKPKDLCGIPWRVAFALQKDGWYLRSDIIWTKRNPQCESVKDRPTRSHEYIFLLAKKEKYYYDADAIREPLLCLEKRPDWLRARKVQHKKTKCDDPNSPKYGKHILSRYLEDPSLWNKDGKNKRDVWDVTVKPYYGSHFATFPEDLIEPCIKAGCPKDGVVLDPFMGSGTTMVVATRENKKSVGIELSEEYIKLAIKRINESQASRGSIKILNQFFELK